MGDVGFIGLGVMGGPMAGHVLDGLAGSGRALVVHTVGRSAAEALLDRGARWADSARQLAQRVELVVLMVPGVPEIRSVLDGPDGLLAGVAGPLTLVVCSTVSPQAVRALDEELDGLTGGRVRVVDAPVSGGETGARAGALSIMVGGPDTHVPAVLELLAPAGRAVHLGPLGAGQVAKACNQLIVSAELAAIAEAAVVAERAGLDVAQLLDLLQGGYAGSVVLTDKADRFARKDHAVSGAAKFLVKDLAAYRDEAERTGTATLLADRLHQAFVDLTAAGLGDLDSSVIQSWLESRSA